MRVRLKYRLFAGFVAIVALMAVLTAGLLGRGLRRELTDTFRGELERELSLGEWIAASLPDAAPDSFARAITDRVGYRVTLISADGVVLGDSSVEPPRLSEVENHSDRPEVQGAIGGTVTFAQRESATIGDPLLYGAKLVEFGGQSVVLRLAAPLTEIERAVDGVQRAVAVAGLLAMLFALLMAYVASRALSQPLVVLAHQARRLAGGDFEERVPRYMNVPELDDLSLAFNRLTDELQLGLGELGRERDEMQALIDCMAEGVVALTDDAGVLRTNRAARALLDLPDAPAGTPIGTLVRHPELRAVLEDSVTHPVSAREVEYGGLHFLVSSRLLDFGGAVTTFLDVTEVHRLERVRRDFVANASHELKTPLTSIRGFAETLLEGDPPDELRAKFLGAIRDNSLRLQRLVDDLLDLTRLESGRWEVEPHPVLLSSAAEEAWAAYADRADSRSISFECEGGVEVVADGQGLDQIFRNLLENALRHTGEGGTISVSASQGDADLVQISVSDDGEGIPSRSLPRIFERFFRADSARAREVGGTGLGLSIVRHLVSAMGGTVEAESELGRGTTIRFTLPRA